MAKLKDHDVIVIGAGHAGLEAALASARMGIKTLLVTVSMDNIGVMSCNPAIGGVGKGQLVKEIDALGGEMAKAADHGGIQFRQLNASKGAAARSSRAQEDRDLYRDYCRAVVIKQSRLTVVEDTVLSIVVDGKSMSGVHAKINGFIPGKAVVISAGTFLNGLIHVGMRNYPGGRLGEGAISGLTASLEKEGLGFTRFKTGTCARLDGRTIDFGRLAAQQGDKVPVPFSFSTKKIMRKQVPCYITYTNEKTHEIIRGALDRSPLYSGVIKSTGVRYCPSLEDKIVRFPARNRHQVFLEPEGLDTIEYYPNGLSTSLPEDVQLAFLRSVEGLERVNVTKYGYGIEYDVLDPTQLKHTLETKSIAGLFFAGQINGTTGYEEAAAQGLIAGVNAALKVKGRPEFVMDRATSYIGILIDDLVTKGTNEPYRMFTSRVEYRLLLREDNADTRLGETGFKLGLVKRAVRTRTINKQNKIDSYIAALNKKMLRPCEMNILLRSLGVPEINRGMPAAEFLKRPEVRLADMIAAGLVARPRPEGLWVRIENEVKYEGYIKRQIREVRYFKNVEKQRIPPGFDYNVVPGLSNEIKEKLNRVRPVSLGQAGRISGVTPAALSILMVYLKRR